MPVLSTLSSSPGPEPVQVWPHKDLLPSRSGCVSGEAAPGPAESRLRHHPETLPWVEPETEVPAHETGSHHPAGVRTWKEVDPVRAALSLVCCYNFLTRIQVSGLKILVNMTVMAKGC